MKVIKDNIVIGRIQLHCPIDITFLLKDTDALIFGGAVRDALANKSINDIDILCLPKSLAIIEQRLIRDGFIRMYENYKEYYGSRKLISPPLDYRKNGVTIQLIKPKLDKLHEHSTTEEIKNEIINFIANVDINCCAVAIDGKFIYEFTQNAFDDAINHIIRINQKALFYNIERTDKRIKKLLARDWRLI